MMSSPCLQQLCSASSSILDVSHTNLRCIVQSTRIWWIEQSPWPELHPTGELCEYMCSHRHRRRSQSERFRQFCSSLWKSSQASRCKAQRLQ